MTNQFYDLFNSLPEHIRNSREGWLTALLNERDPNNADAQPFTDPHIFEVNKAAIAYSGSSHSLTFSDARGIHHFYRDYHSGYVPTTLFIRDGGDVRAQIVWAHPNPISDSDF